MRILRHLIGWIAVVWLAAPSLSPAPRAQSQEAGSATLPRVFLLDTNHLATTRQRIQAGDKFVARALESLETDAKAALNAKLVSVMD